MNEGKAFENDFKNSISGKYYYKRLKDGTTGGGDKKIRLPSKNECDFIIFANKWLFLLELKSVGLKRVPLTPIRKDKKDRITAYGNIKECQISGMMQHIGEENVEAGFIFNFRSENETYFVEVTKIKQYFIDSKKSSIPLEWCQNYGLTIPQRKLIKRYRYDLSTLLK